MHHASLVDGSECTWTSTNVASVGSDDVGHIQQVIWLTPN